MNENDSQLWTIDEEDTVSFSRSSIIPTEEVIQRIEGIAECVRDQILTNPLSEDVEIRLNERRSAANSQVDPILGVFVQYDSPVKKVYSLVKNPHRFAIFFKILEIVYHSLKRKEIITKRSIFYQDPSLFGNQDVVDTVIEDIACCLEVPRTSLGVIACQKGLVAGPLQWISNGIVTDCSKKVEQIPSIIDSIQGQKTRAVAVLVIEKETVFQRLVQSSIVHEVILITGKGVPDYSTRLFIKLLEDSFDIPIVGLFDSDPFGIFIFFVYRFGSRSSAYDGMNMAISSMLWLGIRPTDMYNIRRDKCMELNEFDHKQLDKMLNERNIPEEYKMEIRVLKDFNLKCEIEALLDINHTLTDIFLPEKFSKKDWI